MRLTGVGSMYLVEPQDANGSYLEGDTHYTAGIARIPRDPALEWPLEEFFDKS